MAVMFSGVPDNYDSVFGPLVYTLTGIASGETVDAEVFTVGAETPVGVKRIAGGDAALVNIACYMRRLLTPVPFPADSTGLFSDAGRFVTAAVGCGGAVSPVRTFTGAVRRLSEYEVLTTLPMHRTIAWDESDEVSLLVPGCSMTYSWRVSGEAEYVYESPEYIASRGIVTLVVGMPSVRTTLAAVGVQTDGVAALRVTVRVAGESVAEVHYRIEPREPGSVLVQPYGRVGLPHVRASGHRVSRSLARSLPEPRRLCGCLRTARRPYGTLVGIFAASVDGRTRPHSGFAAGVACGGGGLRPYGCLSAVACVP